MIKKFKDLEKGDCINSNCVTGVEGSVYKVTKLEALSIDSNNYKLTVKALKAKTSYVIFGEADAPIEVIE